MRSLLSSRGGQPEVGAGTPAGESQDELGSVPAPGSRLGLCPDHHTTSAGTKHRMAHSSPGPPHSGRPRRQRLELSLRLRVQGPGGRASLHLWTFSSGAEPLARVGNSISPTSAHLQGQGRVRGQRLRVAGRPETLCVAQTCCPWDPQPGAQPHPRVSRPHPLQPGYPAGRTQGSLGLATALPHWAG